jgi:hypothetical protein
MVWKRLAELLGMGDHTERRGIRATREATPADLEHLRAFVRSRRGVELYVEPESDATDTTAVAEAGDGEWTRRRVGSPAVARGLATQLAIPVYDVTLIGYPAAMRRYRRTGPA